MKYRIVYPNGFTTSACYLVGRDENGRPIHRYYSTVDRSKLSPEARAARRALLAAVLTSTQLYHWD